MHAAQVHQFGEVPRWVEVYDEQTPPEGFVQVKVLAVAVSNLVRQRAGGKHYSTRTLPHTLGVDGAGEYLTGPHKGQKCIFNALVVGHSFQEVLNVPEQDVAPVPDSTELNTVLGWLNPAASSWFAVNQRTADLPKDFTVLIMGVTSSSGRIAIDLMRYLGARKIIGAARNKSVMADLDLHQQIILSDNVTEIQWGDLSGIDLVLDYVWGPPALELMKALPVEHRTQFINIGCLANAEISLPGSLLRSKNLTVNGSGIGSVTFPQMRNLFQGLVKAMLSAKPREVRVEKIENISKVWDIKDDRRLVLTVNR